MGGGGVVRPRTHVLSYGPFLTHVLPPVAKLVKAWSRAGEVARRRAGGAGVVRPRTHVLSYGLVLRYGLFVLFPLWLKETKIGIVAKFAVA